MTGECEWCHAPEACVEDLGDLKKVSELSFSVRRRQLTFGARQMLHVIWGRWKSQYRNIVYLSPYVKKPSNSKVIKSFIPELRCRVFCVSGFLCSLYVHYEHSMYISHIRIMGMLHIYIRYDSYFKWAWAHFFTQLNGFTYFYLIQIHS